MKRNIKIVVGNEEQNKKVTMPPHVFMMYPPAALCVHLSSLPCQPQLKKVMIKLREEGLTVMVKDREYFLL